jgi:hypothetical protein
LEQSLAKLGKRRGHVALGFDLLALCHLLRRVIPNARGRANTIEAELTSAEQLAGRFHAALAHRKAPLAELKRVTEIRDRAFSLFVEAYGQVRRAVQYLRWEQGDADRIMPSLYRRRQSRREKPRAAIGIATTAQDRVAAAPEVAHEHNVAAPEIPQEHEAQSIPQLRLVRCTIDNSDRDPAALREVPCLPTWRHDGLRVPLQSVRHGSGTVP